MTGKEMMERDLVTSIIKECHTSPETAKRMFKEIIAGGRRVIRLPEGEFTMTDAEYGEFVERYSSEVETTLWESKRLKH